MKFNQMINKITNNDGTFNVDVVSTLMDNVFNKDLKWLPNQEMTKAELKNLGAELKGTVPFVRSVTPNAGDPREMDIIIENAEFNLNYVTKHTKINATTELYGKDSVDVLLHDTIGKQYVGEIYKIIERKLALANRITPLDGAKANLFQALGECLDSKPVLLINTENFNELFEYIQQLNVLGVEIHFCKLENCKFVVLDKAQIKLLYAGDPIIGIAEDMDDFIKNQKTIGLSCLTDVTFNPMSVQAFS